MRIKSAQVTLRQNYNSSTLPLQLQQVAQLHDTALHPADVDQFSDQATTATTFRSISAFALPSVIRNN